LLEHSEYKQYVDDGKTPSGTIYEDYLLFICRAMYKELKGDKSDKDVEEEADDVDETESNSASEGDGKDDMPDNYFSPGYLTFAIWGPIMPPGFDKDYKAHTFFAVEQSKEKKKDGRNSIRKEQAEEEAKSRSGMSASEGRGLSNKDQLFATSIAQQSSFACVLQASRDKESRVFFLLERVKQAEADIALWMPHWNSEMFENPEDYQDNFAFKQLMSALQRKDKIQGELDTVMTGLDVVTPSDKYQEFVDDTLGSHMAPRSSKKQRKTVSESASVCTNQTTSSFVVTSVNIPGNAQDKSPSESLPVMPTPRRNPDGLTMCVTTKEYEHLTGHYKNKNNNDVNDSV